ncbi:DUF5676 family membrane protein [Nitratireductor alexandrii]|uniref:DUF5676 family membrane protein n=1 Tax=Nitratireductor alexandrii TaxID=2448161 RepID=UPI001EE796E0|nr:DUF5676 family membrane protein [Nitratireductor alexandrii]
MNTVRTESGSGRSDIAPHATTGQVPVFALGMSLGLFLAITFAVCVIFDLVVPGQAMYRTWLALIPWFEWLSWPDFFWGLGVSFVYGWYVALVFAPLYNLCAGWGSR